MNTPNPTIDQTVTSAPIKTDKVKTTTGSFATIRPHLEVTGPLADRYDEILTPDALEFLAELHEHFAGTRHDLLAARLQTRVDAANGRDPKFLSVTESIRLDSTWSVAGAGPGLEDRRVEITGPTDRKMAINALNSSAKVWLADQEDATSPTWTNVIEGQLTLFDQVRGQLSYTSPEGKKYEITNKTTPTIVMRPRGWHLVEKHVTFVDAANRRMKSSGSLIDFGLYFFHNAKKLIENGTGPYFYLAKLESHKEARLWNDIFTYAEERLGIPYGTVRATVLIETIQAGFEMDEILYELRDHCAGLNAGRWDYIFSIIKTFRARGSRFVFPDRKQITMTVPFMRAYTELLVATCHRRGAFAIGGMSAFIPNRRDTAVTEQALAQVAADKKREATDGFDGSWVAHPDLIPTAQAEFDKVLGDRPNQVERTRPEVSVTAAQLLDVASVGGQITEAGVRGNVLIALRYIESWLRGVGAAAIDNLMEDAATAEISRSQLWQWIHENSVTAEGRRIDSDWVEEVLDEIVDGLERTPTDRFDDALTVLRTSALEPEFPTFLTVGAYARFL
ncbi:MULTISPECIES: malate synthase A [Cryobacterium]|uniref:Malate synthase n=1 Tax=Cryobacterium levicorallinum TaxID=995038 RepID=A0A1I2YQN0_9MICO|nr:MULTISPECIES: malate synthase A [Cryobacterium]TFB86062.1 malate synthase A [Cryobacterium levicorallinum]TFD60345.1 malate synthase A [Cryobacterium sp. Hh38]GEP27587.1 malate synthase [Cryobacterium levicorallinum]SFH26911.1 malate synthase [Cryobacterium levicorallinum]